MGLHEHDQNTIGYLQGVGVRGPLLARVEKAMEPYWLWICVVTVSGHSNLGYESTRSLPTFLLDEQVQGIVDEEHARRIVRGMIEDLDIHKFWTEVSIAVRRVGV